MKLLIFISLSVLVVSSYAFSYYSEQYSDSLEAWKKLNLKNYSYTTETLPGMLDITTTTTITIRNGEVVKREFTYEDKTEILFNDETGEQSWNSYIWAEETSTELGTHDEGFVAITLDDLYSQCGQNVLVQDPVRYEINFSADNNGLISRCTYYPINEVDGTDRGVIIRLIDY